MALIVVTGSPGCGKSTWVRHVAKPGDMRFDSDAITNVLTGREPDKHHHDNIASKISRVAREAGIREAIKHQRDIDVYVLVSNLGRKEESRWRSLGARFVIIDPGQDVAMARCRDHRPGYKHRMVDTWYSRRDQWPRDAKIIHGYETSEPDPPAAAPSAATDKTITELGLGWKHQRQRKRLIARLKDGEPCWWCSKSMYRDAKRNFDGAPLEADHSDSRRDHGTDHLADRLLHRRCNRQRGAGDRDHERPALAPQRGTERAPAAAAAPFSW